MRGIRMKIIIMISLSLSLAIFFVLYYHFILKKLIKKHRLLKEETERLLTRKIEIQVETQTLIEKLKKETEEQASLASETVSQKILLLNQEVADLESKRNSILEGFKREKLEAEKIKYYKIDLSDATLKDISYLEKILDKLNNKEAIAKVIWDIYYKAPTKDLMKRIIGVDKKSGVYKITNLDTQECYIGQGVDVAKRLTEHIKGTLGIQSIADQKVHQEMRKVGLENWSFELIEECSKEKLNEREKFYINFYKSNEYGYNQTKGNTDK